ncbi:hypothetical protein CHARACLAT_025707 [Characodon lateralis]|uniref:Uncharacterized protein n=1 Tax=Characodon lateralis TaxID=208331 RepID=A0ABU7D452_9TELE|nr:hypothetical protein [Characodon lateralis]
MGLGPERFHSVCLSCAGILVLLEEDSERGTYSHMGQRSGFTAIPHMCWWALPRDSVKQMGSGVGSNQHV